MKACSLEHLEQATENPAQLLAEAAVDRSLAGL